MTTTTTTASIDRIRDLLGDEADSLLTHTCTGIPRASIHVPGPDHVDRCFGPSDRNARVLVNLERIYGHGRLGGTGYLSILPVDQGIEHSAASAFAPNPEYFDPENIVKLAIEGGCNAVASTLGVLGSLSRRYAHRIPFLVKINHNELLTYPNSYEQILFASVEQALDMGAAAVGATIYFGSEDARREIEEIAEAFSHAHELGMGTVLWCYLRNEDFKKDGTDYHAAADLTGQANHLGVTIEADIIKQKQADQQRRLQGDRLRPHERPGLRRAHHRPPDRPGALAGGQLLHGPDRADQLGRRVRARTTWRRRCGRR